MPPTQRRGEEGAGPPAAAADGGRGGRVLRRHQGRQRVGQWGRKGKREGGREPPSQRRGEEGEGPPAAAVDGEAGFSGVIRAVSESVSGGEGEGGREMWAAMMGVTLKWH